MKRLAALLLSIPAAAFAAGYPPYASLPRLPIANDAVEVESFGQVEFSTRERVEVHRGRIWLGYLVYARAYGDDARKALGAILAEMEKGGWQVMYRDEPRNPPLATLKRDRDGRVSWASVEMFEHARVAILEVGPPRTRMRLDAPRGGIDKVGESADFPFMKRFPGARLVGTRRDDRPLMVELEPGRPPAFVAGETVLKEYAAPEGTGRLEIAVVYRDALRAAGWQIVEENFAVTTGDPRFTARYAGGGLDLWANVRATGNDYSVAIADAGAERAPGRLRAQLDRECRVPVHGVFFDHDKATLRRESEPALAAIRALLAGPDAAVELGGHTDSEGAREHNRRLSEARAKAVRDWLVAHGVPAARVGARGYGEEQPAATNATEEGRARNRRIELRKPGCPPANVRTSRDPAGR